MNANAARQFVPTPDESTPTPDQFAALRQTIDDLERKSHAPRSKVSRRGAQRGEGANAATAGRPSRSRKGQSTMSDTTQQAPSQPARTNAITLTEMLAVASDLGQQAALGQDVQVKFDLKVLEAAFAGAIDLTRSKHGDGIDDAAKLSEAYVKGRNQNVIFDHKEAKQRKLGSTTRLMIKLGGSPKFGVGEPMGTVNTLMTVRQNLRRTANKGTRLDDAHNTLMRFAREQLKRDTLIVGDELKSFCFKSDSEPRTAAEVLKAIQKLASNLKLGKVSNCPDLDNSPEVASIINACNKRLSAIAKASGEKQAA